LRIFFFLHTAADIPGEYFEIDQRRPLSNAYLLNSHHLSISCSAL
jgi:hypothetical protein